MDTWHKLKYVSHQCVQQTCGSGKRDDTRNQNCAQDSHPALCWRHFGSAPTSLTALQKSVRGSWVDAHMWCPGFVSLPGLAEWTQTKTLMPEHNLAIKEQRNTSSPLDVGRCNKSERNHANSAVRSATCAESEGQEQQRSVNGALGDPLSWDELVQLEVSSKKLRIWSSTNLHGAMRSDIRAG